MAKRRDADSESLPLFDLPLREEPADDDETELAPAPRRPPPRGGGPTSLGDAPRPPAARGEPRRLPFVDGAPAEPDGPDELDAADDDYEDADDDRDDDGDPEPGEPLPPASLGGRLTAGLLDLAAQVAAVAIAAGITYALGVPLDEGDAAAFAVLGLVFSFLYWVVPLAFWGQTPGMTVCGQLTRTLDDEPLTFDQTARRWLGALLTLGLVGLPLLLAATGRSLTDRLSGTKTVRL